MTPITFFVGSVRRRFRVPVYGEWVFRFLPQPRWLKRWYYRKSFEWWGHPSNHHWKCWLLMSRSIERLSPGERDVWTGSYCCIPEHEGERVDPESFWVIVSKRARILMDLERR